MNKYKRVTKKEYDQIKMLFQAGLNSMLVCNVTSRSKPTVLNIKNSTSFENYRVTGKKKPKDELRVSVQDTDVSVNVPELLRKIVDYLEQSIKGNSKGKQHDK